MLEGHQLRSLTGCGRTVTGENLLRSRLKVKGLWIIAVLLQVSTSVDCLMVSGMLLFLSIFILN